MTQNDAEIVIMCTFLVYEIIALCVGIDINHDGIILKFTDFPLNKKI